jgi:hypothetical protein
VDEMLEVDAPDADAGVLADPRDHLLDRARDRPGAPEEIVEPEARSLCDRTAAPLDLRAVTPTTQPVIRENRIGSRPSARHAASTRSFRCAQSSTEANTVLYSSA